jgi:hypothetical protein
VQKIRVQFRERAIGEKNDRQLAARNGGRRDSKGGRMSVELGDDASHGTAVERQPRVAIRD